MGLGLGEGEDGKGYGSAYDLLVNVATELCPTKILSMVSPSQSWCIYLEVPCGVIVFFSTLLPCALWFEAPATIIVCIRLTSFDATRNAIKRVLSPSLRHDDDGKDRLSRKRRAYPVE